MTFYPVIDSHITKPTEPDLSLRLTGKTTFVSKADRHGLSPTDHYRPGSRQLLLWCVRERLVRLTLPLAEDLNCLSSSSTGVERVLNPALCGKPVGITQKSLLATTSYEARARGVTKLMSIRRAKELVPDMILVDGEDLTNYRRFSKRVERLVGAIVGVTEGGERAVEKLGLDEVGLVSGETASSQTR